MKRTFIVFMAFLIAFPAVMAEEPETDAGLTPNSLFYGVDVWWDEMRVKMADSYEEKARLRLQIADERAAEMLKMADSGDEAGLERARFEARNQMQKMEMLDFDQEQIQATLQQRLQKHVMVLETVQESIPEDMEVSLDDTIGNAEYLFENRQLRISEENRQGLTEIKNMISEGKVTMRGKLS
jgi:hypothetical protein